MICDSGISGQIQIPMILGPCMWVDKALYQVFHTQKRAFFFTTCI